MDMGTVLGMGSARPVTIASAERRSSASLRVGATSSAPVSPAVSRRPRRASPATVVATTHRIAKPARDVAMPEQLLRPTDALTKCA